MGSIWTSLKFFVLTRFNSLPDRKNIKLSKSKPFADNKKPCCGYWGLMHYDVHGHDVEHWLRFSESTW